MDRLAPEPIHIEDRNLRGEAAFDARATAHCTARFLAANT
jgi:hypothetical protein